jgi:hypothetical protein
VDRRVSEWSTVTDAGIRSDLPDNAATGPTSAPTPEPSGPLDTSGVGCLPGLGTGDVVVPPGTPHDIATAVRTAMSNVGVTSGWHHLCDRLACRAYGYVGSGYPTAAEHWRQMVATGNAHPGDACPPLGSFVFWRTGRPAGHVSVVVQADPGCDPKSHLAVAALAHKDPLALRAIQAGVPRAIVAKQLPGLEALADTARELSTQGLGRPETLLDSLGQTQLRVRTDDPGAELSDRMVRLRQGVWNLIADRTDVLPSLRLTAGLGVAVHAHAAAFHGADLTAPDGAGPTGPGALVAHGRAWQRLHHALSQFAVLAPPAASVRDDAVAAARLLSELVPLDAPRDRARTATADRHVGAALNGAVQVMADIAVHEGAAFDRLSRCGLLHIPARSLPRDLVTDHPDVAAARLSGRTVPAPTEILRAVAGMYTEVAAHPTGVTSPGPLAHTPAAGQPPAHAAAAGAARELTRPVVGG